MPPKEIRIRKMEKVRKNGWTDSALSGLLVSFIHSEHLSGLLVGERQKRVYSVSPFSPFRAFLTFNYNLDEMEKNIYEIN